MYCVGKHATCSALVLHLVPLLELAPQFLPARPLEPLSSSLLEGPSATWPCSDLHTNKQTAWGWQAACAGKNLLRTNYYV